MSKFSHVCLHHCCAVRVQFVSEAVAAKVVATRRAQVHDRYLKYWAKKVSAWVHGPKNCRQKSKALQVIDITSIIKEKGKSSTTTRIRT